MVSVQYARRRSWSNPLPPLWDLVDGSTNVPIRNCRSCSRSRQSRDKADRGG